MEQAEQVASITGSQVMLNSGPARIHALASENIFALSVSGWDWRILHKILALGLLMIAM